MDELTRATETFEASTAPSPEAVARVEARLRRRTRPRAVTGLLFAAGLVLTLAGAGGYLVGRTGPVGPEPSTGGVGAAPVAAGTTPPAAAGPTIDLPLHDAGGAELTAEVGLRWSGLGQATGTPKAPRLSWSQGTLEVDVAPGRGIDLRVTTDEAEVAVVGTAFTVVRDAFGTHVQVEHGVVQVRCASGETSRVVADASADCGPVHAAPLLRRARALEADDPAAALRDIDAALADPARPALLDDELSALRVALLDRLDRGPDVVAAARAYLAAPGARADEVARFGLGRAETAADRCFFLGARPELKAGSPELAKACAAGEPSRPSPALRP